VEIDDDLWRLIGEEERLLPHLHMSLQAGDDMILKRMKRRHLRNDALAFCQKARSLRPDVVFGADLIAGFPTETEDMFENTRRFVAEADLTLLHVFPYSSRPGTPASRMPQLNGQLIKDRAALLRAEGDLAVQRFFARQTGQKARVLVESIDNNQIHGKTDHFASILLPASPTVQVGSMVSANITGFTDESLLGEIHE
jgi:threonylcarbamoyladenosine tRNA methylthiotransferase MtaB